MTLPDEVVSATLLLSDDEAGVFGTGVAGALLSTGVLGGAIGVVSTGGVTGVAIGVSLLTGLAEVGVTVVVEAVVVISVVAGGTGTEAGGAP